VVRDATCLAPALAILDAADRVRVSKARRPKMIAPRGPSRRQHSRRCLEFGLLARGEGRGHRLDNSHGHLRKHGGGCQPERCRAAMQTWIKRLQSDLHVSIEIDAKVFSSTEEIVRLVRRGELDAAALNIVEYGRSLSFSMPTRFSWEPARPAGRVPLLVKRDGAYKRLSDLRGRRLCISKAPKMCAAPAWLETLLDDERLGVADAFFGSITAETKISRVVLPVFFDQADACIASGGICDHGRAESAGGTEPDADRHFRYAGDLFLCVPQELSQRRPRNLDQRAQESALQCGRAATGNFISIR